MARCDGEEVAMQQVLDENRGGYRPPDPVEVPPLYVWPLHPVKAIRWLFIDFSFPSGFLYAGLAVLTWNFFTPSTERLATLSLDWLALIWLRNAALLTFVAGGLHWWLYVRRSQGPAYKYLSRWPATNSGRFLWRHQVRDNMFWSIASGVTIWSIFEALTLWAWASNRVLTAGWNNTPIYSVLVAVVFILFIDPVHFYLIHRLLHWKPLYQSAHELHHRNVNTGPWTGISMHPLEHVLYFSAILIFWILPAHPFVLILISVYKGLAPAVDHSGFEKVVVGKKSLLSAGDLFHQLHHRHFEVNYGGPELPIDALVGTFHNGTDEAQVRLQHRRRAEQI